jgi:flagellar M-ring protein FliF
MFDRFKTATSQQQILLAVGAAGLVSILLFLAWFYFLRTTYETLFTNMRMSDASAVVAEMDRKKIPYRLSNGGTTILVPSEKVDGARLDMMGGNIPLKSTVGFELFNKADLGLTDFAQKINYQRALQGELERTIMTLDGIESARVHLSLGEDRLFRDDQVAPKASVTVRMTNGRRLSEGAAQGVRRLVAAAVPKMDASDVVILDEEGQTVSVAPQMSSRPSPFAEQKQAIEEYYQGRLREALAQLGLPDMTVTVSAAAADGSTLRAWTPAARQFPLHIALSSSQSLDAERKASVRETVDKTTGSTGQTDSIVFGSSFAEPEMAISPTSARGSRVSPSMPSFKPEEESHMGWLFIGLPALFVLLAGFFLMRKLRGPRPLDAKRRAEFVDRLRIVLEERDGHVASR